MKHADILIRYARNSCPIGEKTESINFLQCLYLLVIAVTVNSDKTGPEVIKYFSCSTELSTKFFFLINVKMPTIVGILTFISRKIAF